MIQNLLSIQEALGSIPSRAKNSFSAKCVKVPAAKGVCRALPSGAVNLTPLPK